jgi:A/G-specific adenine glycosylase
MDRVEAFQRTVWEFYAQHGRHDLPWRQPDAHGAFDPYPILVSEIMLQQTQVQRVIPKYQSFLSRFPSFAALASASLADVLQAWSGLGYNRRAKFLWQAAQAVMQRPDRVLPDTREALMALPGVGANTAGAVLAYAFGRPVVFIETNIRTVFMYHFFADQEQVHDKDILDVVARSLPDDPRRWYWALMDYGSYVKHSIGNLNALSKHYKKQATFAGSRRQLRGQLLRILGEQPQTAAVLSGMIDDPRLAAVLEDLRQEQLIDKKGAYYQLFGA